VSGTIGMWVQGRRHGGNRAERGLMERQADDSCQGEGSRPETPVVPWARRRKGKEERGGKKKNGK